MSSFEKYKQLRDEGKSPVEVYWVAKADKMDANAFTGLLRSVFGISREQAQNVIAQGEAELFAQYVARYTQMRSDGASAQQVYLASKSEGIDQISCLKLLRVVFDLSLTEAKEVSVVGDGLADSSDEFQAKIGKELEKALQETTESVE